MGWNSATQGARDHASRALRANLASVDASIASALLEEFGGLTRALVGSFLRRYRKPLFPVDYDDLIAVADAAVLESWVIYRDGDTSQESSTGAFGGGFRAHVQRIVYQRVKDYAHGLRAQAPRASARCDAHNGALADAPMMGPGPEDRLYDFELRIWLRGALGELSPRERTVLAGVARGDSQAQLGRELGVDKQTVHRVYHCALAKLRDRAEQQGLFGALF